MNPIWLYCRENVVGWIKIPNLLLGLDNNSYCFLKNGIQLICTVEKKYIHASLGPIYSARPESSYEELEQEILEKAIYILQEFFGDLVFIRQPDSPSNPQVKHFFHYLTRKIPNFSEN